MWIFINMRLDVVGVSGLFFNDILIEVKLYRKSVIRIFLTI